MNKLTNQSAFDIVVAHARAQGCRSVDTERSMACLYRGPNGTKCFIGALIPDELYKPEMEYQSFYEVIRDFPELDPILGGLSKNLLDRLQYTHDYKEVCEWEKELQDTAVRFGLTI